MCLEFASESFSGFAAITLADTGAGWKDAEEERALNGKESEPFAELSGQLTRFSLVRDCLGPCGPIVLSLTSGKDFQ